MSKKLLFFILCTYLIIFLLTNIYAKEEVTFQEISNIGNQGVVLAKQGDLNGALELFNKALEMSTQINDNHSRGLALANIGKIYLFNEDYESSRAYLEEAVTIFHTFEDTQNEALFSLALAKVHVRLLNWDDAEYYAHKSIKLFELLKNEEAIDEARLIFGEVYYGQANVYMNWGDFNNSINYFELAKKEYKNGIPTFQRRFAYAYCIMKEGDLYSRNWDSLNAIMKFEESNQLLDLLIRENSSRGEIKEVKELVLAKENFEKGIFEADKLNFNLSSHYFSLAEEGFKNTLNSDIFKDKVDLIRGYFYYSSSNKNYFLFMINGDSNTRSLAEDQINLARESFIKVGFEDLARSVLERKLINFPDEFIDSKDNNLLLSGMSFSNLSYNSKISTLEKTYILFLLKYRYEIPASAKQKMMFCCKEFCSDWKEITRSNLTEIRIQVESHIPREIYCEIEAYGEKNPKIPLGTIEKYYQLRFIDFKLDKNKELTVYVDSYNPVEIIIVKPWYEQAYDLLKLPQVILGLLVGVASLYLSRKKILEIAKKVFSIIIRIIVY